MNDNDNRRPRRRAARSAGPPVEEAVAATVTIGKSETASPTEVVDTVEVASTAVVDNTDKPADAPATTQGATAKIAAVSVPPAAETVRLTKLADSDSADTEIVPASDSAAFSDSTGRVMALAAAVVLVLALVVGAGFAAVKAYSLSTDEDLRAQYTETARQAVLNLTTIRAGSAKEDIDRILSVASGDFKTEFDGRVDPFLDIVKQANVVSTGEVVESGIVTADGESAQVLVAAKQTVSNNGSPEPQSRQYRFRITVSNADTGMTVSKVEFVG
ncbi:hypothetical protein [Nocardia sp. AG03]|uniref:hypothetical protein n=1 Tax=Nocardia sp. AG03 TaxID=3025312 RepID=UPI0024182D15|nr:hypothetical protein [Nocardia sp. AG03]